MKKMEEVKNGLCYMCTASCPTKIHVSDGKITKIELTDATATSCPRWKAQLDFIYHPDRLQYPLKRTGERGGNSFERISWDGALEIISGNLMEVKEQYGPESVAFWIAYTKEPRPYFHRLAHAFGSPNYCTESSNCFSATWLAARLTYGPDYSDFATQDIEPGVKCKLIWGNAIQNSSPMLWRAHLEAKEKGLKLIVVDPRRTKIAELADVHLQAQPGTDGALALGMMNIIISENMHDSAFIEKWTVGFDGLKNLVQAYSPERVESITKVPAAKIREAARLYATQKPARLHTSGNSTVQHTNGVQNHRAIILLPAITGNIDTHGLSKPSAKINDITLHELVERMPPGVGSMRFPIWTKLYREMQANAIADQIDSAAPYPIKALFSAGLDLQFFANSDRMAKSLKNLDSIAVTEYFLTPGARLADIVLPIASWVERYILTAAYSPVIKLIEPAIQPLGESRSEWDIYAELARRLGFGELFWDGDFKKCAQHIIEPLGVTLEYLRQYPEGVPNHLMAPLKDETKEGFATPSGKVEIASSTLTKYGLEPLPIYREPPESPLSRPDLVASYPLVMTTGARTSAYTHSQFRNIPRLRRLMPDPLLEINPADARPRGIKSGDTVVITSPRNRIRMKAKVTDAILAGVVSLPHHWPGEANANALIDDRELDPISGFLPCKSQLCQVARD
jgi:anaerobic selenocysteine-containing dehydrogenase